MLAGMSADYYMRLEQGREANPSPQVVEAVADALRLDAEPAEHLRRLVQAPEGRRRRTAGARVSPQLLRLMDGWTACPAFVLGPALDVLACNALAAALYEGFERADNLARMVFADPAGREFYPDWERAAHSCVAELRAAYGHDPRSERIGEVVADLSARSPEFAALWARHDVKAKTQDRKRLRHPVVGDLSVSFSAFSVNGAPGQELVVYQAESGATAAAFGRLGERRVRVG